MDDESLRKVDEYWAGYFGVAPEVLRGSRTIVASNIGHDGVRVFRRGQACIVFVPPEVSDTVRNKLRGASPKRAFEPEFLAKTFAVLRDQISPSVWMGVCDRTDFKPIPTKARVLTARNSKAIRRLYSPFNRRAGMIAAAVLADGCKDQPYFGAIVGRNIVAATGYVNAGGVLACIGVMAHPQHPGKGHAKTVVSAAMNHAFEKGLYPMLRTPASSKTGVALARSLGFRPYAFTLDVDLTRHEF